MAYGTNAPWGLKAVKTLSAAENCGVVSTLPINIAPGATTFSIFEGDLVAVLNGYLVSYYQIISGAPNTQTAPVIGVFKGCSYKNKDTSLVDYASPAQNHFLKNTQTLGDVNPIGYFYEDPNFLYDGQVLASGVDQTMVGDSANVNFQTAGGDVIGNTDGTSKMTIDLGNMGGGVQRPLRIRSVVDNAFNKPGVNYNNALVVIGNHKWRTSPAV